MEERYVIFRGRAVSIQRGSPLESMLDEAWTKETSDDHRRKRLEIELYHLVSVVLEDYKDSVKRGYVFVISLDGWNLQGRWVKDEGRSFLVTHRLNVWVEGKGWSEED